jgi:hypothetical protein
VGTARIRFHGQQTAAAHCRYHFLDSCVVKHTPACGLALPVGSVDAVLERRSLGSNIDGHAIAVGPSELALKKFFHAFNVCVRLTSFCRNGSKALAVERHEQRETRSGSMSVLSGSSAMSRET